MTETILSGVVVKGDQRGRKLGFPTANVEVSSDSPDLPADGVYAGWLERARDGLVRLPSAISIGSRPTYYGEHGARLVEVFVLDFSDDLYGEHIRVGVGQRVRGQIRYEGDEALIEQMHRDIAEVRSLAAKDG